MSERPRLLIFVIAYQAEATLRKVLERIPARIFEMLTCEILVVDDASRDRTFEIGCEYRDAHPDVPLTVLRNEFNQGYGGNQKVGYAYAIAHDFDFVAMVHGDGQYAPEELPKLVTPLLAGEAQAVFGSRMMSRFGALKGGMPLYKFVGNKILTTMQNALLGTRLSEFHSGYRIYAVRALKRLPFHLNSNDFHFDTEIIIQFLNAGLRIVELPIPTFYGDEISRVNGMKYAKDVMIATARNALHRAGVLYQRRFDTAPKVPPYTSKRAFPSSHSYALERVPDGARVLHVGRDFGGVVEELARRGCDVELVEAAPGHKYGPGVRVHTQNLDEPPGYSLDVSHILLLDVLEQLHSPEDFLDELRKKFDFKARTLVLTTPNVAFFVQRMMLALGQFNYGKQGVLDFHHARLFTFRSAERLLRDAGFRVKEVRGIPAPFPRAFGPGALSRAALELNQLLIRLSKTLFAYQILIVAESTPDLEFVLARAVRSERAATPEPRRTDPKLN
jgi:glycosyltransferase involved in cell wall biosynthesis